MHNLVIASVFAAVPLFAYADAADDFIEARAGYMKMLAINMAMIRMHKCEPVSRAPFTKRLRIT